MSGTPGAGERPGGSAAVGPEAGGAMPVPRRLERLAAVVDRNQRSDRDVRKIMQVLGMLAIGFGFVCIVLGWYGAAHSPYQFEEIPYIISGGLLGVALVIGGGILVMCAWSLRRVEESRRNAVAIIRSIDRLERALRSRDEPGSERRFEEEVGA
ncbi:MAG TPA: hypothetical protein VL961_08660 [Acidimicrobiales bacterium]|nr:hypothetical protein [Acidimicrobiales bacterium]